MPHRRPATQATRSLLGRTRRSARATTSAAVVAVACTGLGLGLGAGAAQAAPVGAVTSFPAGVEGTAMGGIAAGPDGNVWYADRDRGGLSSITPTGVVRALAPLPKRNLPAGAAPAPSIETVVTGTDGNLWTATSDGRLVRVTPAGVVTAFDDPARSALDEDGAPEVRPVPWMTAGDDGSIWWTDPGGNRVGHASAAGAMAPDLPDVGAPFSLTTAPDGSIWFGQIKFNLLTFEASASFGRVAPDGTLGPLAAPTLEIPTGLAATADGRIWFSKDTEEVRSFDPAAATPTFTTVTSPGAKAVTAVAAGPDGALWYLGASTAQDETVTGYVGRIAPGSTAPQEWSLPGVSPLRITAGADGNMWFTDELNSVVSRVGTGAPAAVVSAPAVSGGAVQGSLHTCGGDSWATWAGKQPAALRVAWLRDGAVIDGATARTYRSDSGDLGRAIACRVTATYTSPRLTVPATSDSVAIKAVATPTPTPAPASAPTPTPQAAPAGPTAPTPAGPAAPGSGAPKPAPTATKTPPTVQVQVIACKLGKGAKAKRPTCTTTLVPGPLPKSSRAVAGTLGRNGKQHPTEVIVGKSALRITSTRVLPKGLFRLIVGRKTWLVQVG